MNIDPEQVRDSCGDRWGQVQKPSGDSWGCVGTTHPNGTGRESLLEALGYHRPNWQLDALCREYRHLDFTNERGRMADQCHQVCGRCAVLAECRAYAVADPDLVGIWGGTDSAARRATRRTQRRREEQ